MADNWINFSQVGYNTSYETGIRNSGSGSTNFGYYNGGANGGNRGSDGGCDGLERGRSQSLTPSAGLGDSPWDRSRRQSAPVRWHPQYAPAPQNVRASASNWTMQSLETIHEDGNGSRATLGHNRHLWSTTNTSQSIHGYRPFSNDRERRFSHDSGTNNGDGGNQRRYLSRSTSDGSLHKTADDMRKNNNHLHNYQQVTSGHKSSSSSSNEDNKNNNVNEDKKRRRKSQISFDTSSEKDIRNQISDVRSVKSGKSKASLTSKYRPSDNVSNSPGGTRSTSSKAPRSSVSRGAPSTSVHRSYRKKSSSSRISDASYLSGSKTRGSLSGDPGGEVKVTVAQSPADIPVELLDLRRPSWKKIIRPLMVTVLVISLIVSLFVAVFFASALKESQERQIEFLQATLEFSLSQNQRSRDFSSLTNLEVQELKSAYCRQVDALYRGSVLTDEYRGCQLDVLTNDRIEFTLYFLDESGPPKGAVEIMSILEKRADQQGMEGQGLVTISDVTLDLSPSKSSVDLAVTSKPEDFIGANSQVTGGENKNDREGKMTTITIRPTTIETRKQQRTMITTTPAFGGEDNSQTLDDSMLSKNICRSIDASEVVAHPFSCGHFIQCEFGTPIARPCSGGLVFDPEGRACVKPNANLPCTEVKPCDNVNGGHFAHPTDCRLFEICDQGKPVMLSCPPSLIWDEHSQNCVPKKKGTQCQLESS